MRSKLKESALLAISPSAKILCNTPNTFFLVTRLNCAVYWSRSVFSSSMNVWSLSWSSQTGPSAWDGCYLFGESAGIWCSWLMSRWSSEGRSGCSWAWRKAGLRSCHKTRSYRCCRSFRRFPRTPSCQSSPARRLWHRSQSAGWATAQCTCTVCWQLNWSYTTGFSMRSEYLLKYLVEILHLCTHWPVEVEAFGEVRAAENASVCAGDAQQSSLSHCSDGCVQERDDWAVGVQVNDVETSSFGWVSEQDVGVLEAELVGVGVQLVEFEVIFHEFVGSR